MATNAAATENIVPALSRPDEVRRRGKVLGTLHISLPAWAVSVLAHASVPIVERYYLALSLLLKAGSGRISQDALERQCQLMAERMSLLYELRSPEFFERAQFDVFLSQLRTRKVLQADADGRLVYEPEMLEAIAADAQFVLHEQIRNSILQVVHR